MATTIIIRIIDSTWSIILLISFVRICIFYSFISGHSSLLNSIRTANYSIKTV